MYLKPVVMERIYNADTTLDNMNHIIYDYNDQWSRSKNTLFEQVDDLGWVQDTRLTAVSFYIDCWKIWQMKAIIQTFWYAALQKF